MMLRGLRELCALARDSLLLWLVVTIFLVVGLFVVYPLAKVAIASLQTRGGAGRRHRHHLGVRERVRAHPR